MGIITPESINTLEIKLGGAFTIVKSTHFVDGQCYGFLSSVIPLEKYRVVISNPTWVYAAPANPGACLAAALVAGVKTATAKAKEQQNTHCTHPNARRVVPLPRLLINPPTQPAVPLPRVQADPTVDDCHVVGGGSERQIVGDNAPRQGKHGPPSTGPNYISQDEDEEHNHGYNTHSRTTSIMQEAMLACIDITKPNFKILAAKMASQKLPMMWLCEMANSVLGEQDKLLEYRHLIANPKTRATWTDSYGNELGRLAQGMPGQAKGTDTIFFIPRHMVPKEREGDVTYGLITCLI